MSYLRLLHEIELDNALRRSLVQEALTEQLTRSRIEAAIQLEKVRQEATFTAEFALRRSRVEAEIEASRTITEAALHRSRVAADIQVTWQKAEESIRRSRIEAQVQCQRTEREAVLRRSRVQSSIRRDLVTNIIQKSRLQSELQQSRLHQHRNIAEGLRRSRIEAETQKLSRKY